MSLVQIGLAGVVSATVAYSALDRIGVKRYHLAQLAIAVLGQAVVASGTGAGLDLLADVALLVVGTLNHASGLVLVHAQLDQRLNHGVAVGSLNEERVLNLGVDWQDVAA